MSEVAFSIGPISVRWYGLLIASAMLIGFIGGSRMAKKQGLNEDDFLSTVIAVIITAVIGARCYYVVFNWGYYGENPAEIVAIWHGGLAIHGGILGGLLALVVCARHYRMNVWQLGDIFAPWLALGQAIGRWGNFFNQEAYGYVVSKEAVPWAMYIDGAWRHPTFLYESIWDLMVFAVLMVLIYKGRTKRGEVMLSYFMLYSLGRVWIEGLRTDSLMLGPLRMAQVMSIGLFLIALAVFIYRRRKDRREQEQGKKKS